MSRINPHRRQSRGFTLMELLLVLAIIVAVAAMVAPALEGPMETRRLRNAAEVIRAEWSQARVKAMREAQIFAFRYEPGGRKYTLQEWTDIGEPPQTESEAPMPLDADLMVPEDETLPERVIFFDAEAALDSRAIAAEQLGALFGTMDDTFNSPAILFYPDGATSDARLELRNEDGQAVTIELRGLTGLSRVGEVYETEDQP